MANYAEDQNNEIEALESIYANEFTIIEREPFAKFSIKLSTEDYEENEVKLTCQIEFEFKAKYPDEAPRLEITEFSDDFLDEYKPQLEKLLNDEAQNNLGMVMIFTLVSAATEWMTNKVEERKEATRLEKERKFKEQQEIEQKKFEGELRQHDDQKMIRGRWSNDDDQRMMIGRRSSKFLILKC